MIIKMKKIRKQNIFNTTWAAFKFVGFWLIILINLPILFILPIGKLSVGYMRFFSWTLMKMVGIKLKLHGKLSKERPLMVVSNHISIFEIVGLSVLLGGGFFGKKEIESFPIIGWIGKKCGMIFVDRRPSHAMDALKNVENQMKRAHYPMILFPEGTTTNGAYVKKFKSTLFNFIGDAKVVIQPIVINYRYFDGSKIDDETLANNFAYFDNKKQDMGPLCKIERSAFGQLFHNMVLGGFIIEVSVLPVPDLTGYDRKEIADVLHKIVSEKYNERK